MKTAIIIVSGGVVQNIITDDPNLKTIVIDADAHDVDGAKEIIDHDTKEHYNAYINDDAPEVDEEIVKHYTQQLKDL